MYTHRKLTKHWICVKESSFVGFFFADGKEGDSCITSYQYRGKGKYGKEIEVVSNVTLVFCYPSHNHYGVVRRFADGPSFEPQAYGGTGSSLNLTNILPFSRHNFS